MNKYKLIKFKQFNDLPFWINPWIIYPLTLLIYASQEQCLKLIDKYQKL